MARTLRCAIYTRKSTEEGLEQGFNSLHAQREACEAYVLSQAGEGWTALPTIYDDGGFSGGTMERPGLARLLADIDSGKIDVVVVYKVDRLTRSLNDFARIVDRFDARSVSFVSVTQAFNTTSSMGRLTLNVLLSFAQFEREVTGERIRDKIAASKRKGMWMGGNLPLGYDAPTDLQSRALIVSLAEAETVQHIFRRYLALKSVHSLRAELEQQGVRSKVTVSARGNVRGGVPFNRGALFYLLKNRVYLGEILHKGSTTFTDAHPAIIDRETFDKVQGHLTGQARLHRERPTRVSTMPLKGLIFDADGNPMSPAFTRGRQDRVYRYYVSTPLLQGVKDPLREGLKRVPAGPVEDLVRACLTRLSRGRQKDIAGDGLRIEVLEGQLRLTVPTRLLVASPIDTATDIETIKSRLGPGERISTSEGGEGLVRVMLPCRFLSRGGRVWITDASGRSAQRVGSIDKTLIRGLRLGHQFLAQTAASPLGRPELVVLDQSFADPYHRKLGRLAFLAPDVQAMILEGRQPETLNLQTLVSGELPLLWEDQRRLFGIGA